MRRFVFGLLCTVAAVGSLAHTASALTPEISAQFRARTELDLHRGLPADSLNDDDDDGDEDDDEDEEKKSKEIKR